MGNTLAIMQKELILAESPAARDAKETLDRLEDMAEDRIALFYDKIGHEERDRLLIPIDKILNKYTHVSVVVEESEVWIQGVKDAVREFSAGPFAEGLSLVAINTINKMLCSSFGRRQTTEGYTIAIDCLGGISRLDYYFLTYTFTSTELVKKRASLVACCIVESSADVRDLDANTLRVLIARFFKAGLVPRKTLTAMHTQVMAAVNEQVEDLTMTSTEKESLEVWFKSGDQKVQTDENDDSAANGDAPTEGGPVEVEAA